MSLIKKHIVREGLTQHEFAARLGISHQAVSAYLRRARTPRPRMMRRLAEELRVEIEQLAAEFYR
jgi:transcriptional regulator with XRE-family HTH domain